LFYGKSITAFKYFKSNEIIGVNLGFTGFRNTNWSLPDSKILSKRKSSGSKSYLEDICLPNKLFSMEYVEINSLQELNDDEKKTVFSIVDAFAGKKKLKDALSNVLNDVK
jgi:hypothetical protein